MASRRAKLQGIAEQWFLSQSSSVLVYIHGWDRVRRGRRMIDRVKEELFYVPVERTMPPLRGQATRIPYVEERDAATGDVLFVPQDIL
jgi:hypothetical protein